MYFRAFQGYSVYRCRPAKSPVFGRRLRFFDKFFSLRIIVKYLRLFRYFCWLLLFVCRALRCKQRFPIASYILNLEPRKARANWSNYDVVTKGRCGLSLILVCGFAIRVFVFTVWQRWRECLFIVRWRVGVFWKRFESTFQSGISIVLNFSS